MRAILIGYVLIVGIPSGIIAAVNKKDIDLIFLIFANCVCLMCVGITYSRFSIYLNYLVMTLNIAASILIGG